MSRGPSGRIVVELDPAIKNQLYVVLSVDRLTFKEWLLSQVEHYISERSRSAMRVAELQSPKYGSKVNNRTKKRK